MKKSIIIALCSMYLTAFGCQVMLENDSGTWVSVTDLKAFSPTEFVTKRKKIKANKDPQEYADLRVVIGSSPAFIANPNADTAKQSYRVTQTACSGESHFIPLKTSDIQKGTVPSIITIKKERI